MSPRARFLVVVASGLVALVAAALVMRAIEPTGAPQHGWTVAQMEQELMCPTCHTRLDMSTEPVANQIRGRLAVARHAGWSKAHVERYLESAYGPAVLGSPPHHGFGLAAWLVPGLALGAGALLAAALARRWAASPRDEPPLALAVSPAERDRLERRLDAELERFE